MGPSKQSVKWIDFFKNPFSPKCKAATPLPGDTSDPFQETGSFLKLPSYSFCFPRHLLPPARENHSTALGHMFLKWYVTKLEASADTIALIHIPKRFLLCVRVSPLHTGVEVIFFPYFPLPQYQDLHYPKASRHDRVSHLHKSSLQYTRLCFTQPSSSDIFSSSQNNDSVNLVKILLYIQKLFDCHWLYLFLLQLNKQSTLFSLWSLLELHSVSK